MLQAGIFGFGPNSSLNQWTRPRRLQHPAPLPAPEPRDRQPRADQAAAGAAVAGHHRLFRRAGRGGGGRDPGPGPAPVGGRPGRPGRSRLRTGIITFNGTFEGLKQTSRFGDVLVLISRPQEAVYALQLLQRGLRRVLHHGRRVQPGAVRAVPRPGLSGAGGRRSSRPGEVLPVDLTRPSSCPRWATARPRPRDERRPSRRRPTPGSRRGIREGSPDSDDGTARLAIDPDRGLRCSLGRRRRHARPRPRPRATAVDGTRRPAPRPPAAAAVDGVPRHRALRERKVQSLARPTPATAEGRRQGPSPSARYRRRWPRRSPAPLRRWPPGVAAGRPPAVPPPRPPRHDDASRTPPSPLATRRDARPGAGRAQRPPLPDQPGRRRLRLSDARPLIVAAAQASVWVAEAELDPGQGPLGPRRSTSASTTSATTAAAPTSTRAS